MARHRRRRRVRLPRPRRARPICRRRDLRPRHLLPEEFRGCTMIVSPSARTGLQRAGAAALPDVAPTRPPYPLPVLKAWMRGSQGGPRRRRQRDLSGRAADLYRQATLRQHERSDPAADVGRCWSGSGRTGSNLVADRFMSGGRDRAQTRNVASNRMVDPVIRRRRPRLARLSQSDGGRRIVVFRAVGMGLGLAARSHDSPRAVVNFTLS